MLVVGGWTQVTGRAFESRAAADPDTIGFENDVPTPEPPPLQTRWTSLWANVRTEPRESALILEQLPPGTRVEGVRQASGWWLIYLDGDSAGYIAGALLRMKPPDSLQTESQSP